MLLNRVVTALEETNVRLERMEDAVYTLVNSAEGARIDRTASEPAAAKDGADDDSDGADVAMADEAASEAASEAEKSAPPPPRRSARRGNRELAALLD